MIRRIGSALRALHSKHIYHLDVKPENIIYESNDNHSPMKLADFGCSLQADYLNADTKWVYSFLFILVKLLVQQALWLLK